MFDGGAAARFRSSDYATPIAMMEDAIAQLRTRHEGEGWVTFEARGPRGKLVVETTVDCVNTCQETVDIASLLRSAGERELAGRTGAPQKCLVYVRDATPRELALAVDAVFRQHYGLGREYAVCADIDG